MSEAQEKKLVEKLAEACDKVGGVEKKGKNAQQNYAYVKAADVAKSIRHELFSRGIVIIPNEESCEFVEFQTKAGTVMKECRLKTAYHITDGVDTLIMHGYGVAMDAGDKAIYKAKTGALKYFLRGLGLIPDEKDDPEADEVVDKVVREESTQEFDQRTDLQRLLAPHQANALHEAMKRSGKPSQMVEKYLVDTYKVNQFEKLMRADFQAVLKWLNSFVKRAGDENAPQSNPSQGDAKTIREAVNKKLWAVAAEKSVPEGDIKKFADENYKVESMRDLTAAQLREIIDWLNTLA